ncbi:TOC75-3, chloroplastic, partial [Olea europaea subsp. europaea]
LGVGSKFPFFNRHQLIVTQFFQLKQAEEAVGKPPPPVLVLHGHYGGCVGDLPNYDVFTLGGPYSVRGYNTGELGAARNVLELAAELRISVRNMKECVYLCTHFVLTPLQSLLVAFGIETAKWICIVR